MQLKQNKSNNLPGYAGLLLGVCLIIYLFSQIDLEGAIGRILSIGFSSVLILLPFLVLHVVETFAWIKVFPPGITRIPFFPLLRIQLIAETVSMTLPAGVAVGEPLRPYLCNRFIGLPVPESVASVAVRKLMLGAAQGLYTVIGAFAGYGFLQMVSRRVIGFEGLGLLMVISGLAVFLLFMLFLLLLLNGSVAGHIHRFLMLVPFRKLKAWLLEKESGFLDTDQALNSYRGFPAGGRLLAMFYYVLAWFMLTAESYIILTLLGVEISFYQIFAIDIALAMLRSLFFFIPSGLGVQDLGYLLFFQALGIHDFAADGAAFVLLRRFKEVLWYSFGYGVMFLSGVHLGDAQSGGNNDES
ncbi:MAG: flippase-like domain-containing protein [Chlorobium limicola]|nr:lysylphosphatidylglycerol synthase transmembrane domain-containing protein [Chlorobium limicola]NTV21777.1 flippase-like domain-containing protein [Chlorobium limicola]